MLAASDPEADATYVKVSDAPVTTTQQIGDSLCVDLDAEGAPVGVELLMAPARATEAILAPLLASYPELSTVRDALHCPSLPATASRSMRPDGPGERLELST